MPPFNYKARDKSGQPVTGVVDANDRAAAVRQIERQGLTPVAVTAGAAAPAARASAPRTASRPRFKWTSSHKQRMSMYDVLTFSTELSDLLASGMTLGNALSTLANRKTGKDSDLIIRDLRDEIVKGSSLSDAFAKHPATFSTLYVSMVRVGEASGALAEVMTRLVEHYERIQELKEKVVMALVYPAIVIVLGLATLVFSLVFVIPKFSAIFRELGQTLPLPTRILIGTSSWMLKYGWLLIGLGVVGAILARRAVRTPGGRRWWHGLQLRLPMIKGIIAASTFANLARTLGTLLKNGVPALQALTIVEQTVGNVVIAAEIRNARERVTDGTTISGPLAAGKVFPPLMTDMLAIGEQTGDMSGALKHIAHRYENELTRSVKIFTTALEPMLIVIVAVAVGFVAVSILMAVFNLTNGLNV
jgi:type II secretory pathway component PulF